MRDADVVGHLIGLLMSRTRLSLDCPVCVRAMTTAQMRPECLSHDQHKALLRLLNPKAPR